MKRTGNLFDRICDANTLMAAWLKARDGKRSHRATFCFERALGANLERIKQELQAGTYRPAPLNRFWVCEGRKPRLIEAPSFRDLVVQHAIYAVVQPLLEARYIDSSFACRVGKGTHRAANWLQAEMRKAPRNAWTLHVDVRRYFYSIDREILRSMLERVIKCRPTLDLMLMFAHRPEPVGVPIGNLLSQTFSNLYLNSLDQYCKRTLKIKSYARYVDDSVAIAPDRTTALAWLRGIQSHLALLGLEISHFSLQPVRRGLNWCGYRTWSRARFVRPHLISSIRRDARSGNVEAAISRLGHARATASLRPLLKHLQEHHHAFFDRLPQSVRAQSDAPVAIASIAKNG